MPAPTPPQVDPRYRLTCAAQALQQSADEARASAAHLKRQAQGEAGHGARYGGIGYRADLDPTVKALDEQAQAQNAVADILAAAAIAITNQGVPPGSASVRDAQQSTHTAA